jgi:hypothetical protein
VSCALSARSGNYRGLGERPGVQRRWPTRQLRFPRQQAPATKAAADRDTRAAAARRVHSRQAARRTAGRPHYWSVSKGAARPASRDERSRRRTRSPACAPVQRESRSAPVGRRASSTWMAGSLCARPRSSGAAEATSGLPSASSSLMTAARLLVIVYPGCAGWAGTGSCSAVGGTAAAGCGQFPVLV